DVVHPVMDGQGRVRGTLAADVQDGRVAVLAGHVVQDGQLHDGRLVVRNDDGVFVVRPHLVGVPRGGEDADVHVFVVLGDRVVNRAHGQGHLVHPRRDGDRAGKGDVIRVRRGGARDVQVDRQVLRDVPPAGDGEQAGISPLLGRMRVLGINVHLVEVVVLD